MTLKELNEKKKSLGSTVLFNLIMALIVVVSFAYDILSDYVNFGFDADRLRSAAFWIELATNNAIRIALCLTFREVMIDNEMRVNRLVEKRAHDIETAHGVIASNKLQTDFEEHVADLNKERKFKHYEAQVKADLEKSKYKRAMEKLSCEIKCEEAKTKPSDKKLDSLKSKYKRAEIFFEGQQKKLATAREDSEWKKVKGYKAIKPTTILSTVDTSKNSVDENNFETRKGQETALFVSTKVVFIVILFVFVGSLIPYGKAFEISLLWNTAVKILFGAISLYLGGSNGVEYVRKVVVPVLLARANFLLKFLELKKIEATKKKQEDKDETAQEEKKEAKGDLSKEFAIVG